jgi:exonuclease VII small subunit
MSSIAADSPARPRIFEKWPKAAINFQQEPASSRYKGEKQNESLRSEEALKNSQRLLTNINAFTQNHDRIVANYREFVTKSEGCRARLDELSQEQGRKFEIGQYQSALKNYHFLIRNEHKYHREAQGFRFANLANYNPQQTNMRLTRKPSECREELQERVKCITQKRMQLQEALAVYEQGLPRSDVLSSQYDLEGALSELNKETTG